MISLIIPKGLLVLIWAINIDFSGGSDSKESTCNAGDLGLIPGSGTSPGEGNGYPLQYSCLENPMDRESWATFLGATKRHSWVTKYAHSVLLIYSHKIWQYNKNLAPTKDWFLKNWCWEIKHFDSEFTSPFNDLVSTVLSSLQTFSPLVLVATTVISTLPILTFQCSG